MTEIEDLRGATIDWLVSRERPLLCALKSSTGGTGSLTQHGSEGPVEAWLASVSWQIERIKVGEIVRFGDTGPTIAVAGGTSLTPYEAEIDGIARYRLVLLPQGGAVVWHDLKRQAVFIRRHHASLRCESGAITVSRTCTLEHAPILVLLGQNWVLRHPRKLLSEVIG